MPKKLVLYSLVSWLLALSAWQALFYSHTLLAPVLWEIHTIFSSVLVFYLLVNAMVPEKILDIIKIGFRILFKVWFVIFIAFSLKKSFDLKAFLLTATFVFGYLEGLIDLNAWLSNRPAGYIFSYFGVGNHKDTRVYVCLMLLSVIHIFSALIACVFFSIK